MRTNSFAAFLGLSIILFGLYDAGTVRAQEEGQREGERERPPEPRREDRQRRRGRGRGRLEDFWKRERNREPGVHEKNHAAVRGAFRDIVSRASRSTTQILCDGKKSALGTIVHEDGYVVTKASELKGDIECKFKSGPRVEATVALVDEENDLALLKVAATELLPVEWRTGESPPIGSWLASAGPGDDPIAVGVVSVALRDLASSRAFLGVATQKVDTGLRIERVVPDTSASKAGLRAGDIITELDGKTIERPDELFDTLQGMEPGDELEFKVRRGDEDLALKVELGRRPAGIDNPRTSQQDLIAGALSERRRGFPQALQHDTVLHPTDCGGPIVGLDGKVVGINIARAGRVESFAVPATAVQALVDRVEMSALVIAGAINADRVALIQAELRELNRELERRERLVAIDEEILELEEALEAARAAGDASKEKATGEAIETSRKARAAVERALEGKTLGL